MFDRPPQEQARRPLLATIITVAVFASGEWLGEPLLWYARLLGLVLAGWTLLVYWQWIYSTAVSDWARYKLASIRTPASETAHAMQGLDADARKLLGQLHVLSVGLIPGNEPEVMIYGTNLNLEHFLYFLDACDNWRLVSVRNYPDRTEFPNRTAASEFVNYCVVRGWAIPARVDAQNEPAHWITGWDKWQVRNQFGTLLGDNPRAQDTQEGDNPGGGEVERYEL